MSNVELPVMAPTQVAVLCADVATGIVLAPDGSWALGDAERCRVRASFEDAEAEAKELVRAHPGWECTLFDSRGQIIAVLLSSHGFRGEDR